MLLVHVTGSDPVKVIVTVKMPEKFFTLIALIVFCPPAANKLGYMVKLLGTSESTIADAGVKYPLSTPEAHVTTGSL